MRCRKCDRFRDTERRVDLPDRNAGVEVDDDGLVGSDLDAEAECAVAEFHRPRSHYG